MMILKWRSRAMVWEVRAVQNTVWEVRAFPGDGLGGPGGPGRWFRLNSLRRPSHFLEIFEAKISKKNLKIFYGRKSIRFNIVLKIFRFISDLSVTGGRK